MNNAAPAWAGVVVLSLTLIVSILLTQLRQRKADKNGSVADARALGGLFQKVANMEALLSSPEIGLGALKSGMNDMKSHCAGVSSGLAERVKGLENDMKEIKKGGKE